MEVVLKYLDPEYRKYLSSWFGWKQKEEIKKFCNKFVRLRDNIRILKKKIKENIWNGHQPKSYTIEILMVKVYFIMESQNGINDIQKILISLVKDGIKNRLKISFKNTEYSLTYTQEQEDEDEDEEPRNIIVDVANKYNNILSDYTISEENEMWTLFRQLLKEKINFI